VLTVSLDRGVRVLKVTGFAERRGDATTARALYEDMAGNAAKSDLPGPS
jgi:ribosome-associated heat shock protein Hsp15